MKLRHWRPFGWSRALLLMTVVWAIGTTTLIIVGVAA